MEDIQFTYQKIEWTWNDGGITAETTGIPHGVSMDTLIGNFKGVASNCFFIFSKIDESEQVMRC